MYTESMLMGAAGCETFIEESAVLEILVAVLLVLVVVEIVLMDGWLDMTVNEVSCEVCESV